MKNFKKFLMIILISCSIQITNAKTNFSTRFYFNSWAQKNEIVGAALALDNKVYFYGYSNKHSAVLVTRKTQFGIGSITKTFISVILLKLEAEGKLNIHDPVTKYLPQYSKLKNVTIQSLMQMTAGFNDVAKNPISYLQEINMAYPKYNPKLSGNWLYSNASYQLLGLLIEKITQKSLADILSSFITKPLHLRSIYFPNKLEAISLKEYQNGHVKISDFNNEYAAGGLVSNVKDLESFIWHLFVAKDLLPAKQYTELTTFVKTSEKYYAFTGIKAPQFGLGVFKWNIPPYGDVFSYTGVLDKGFTSSYTVIGNNIIISQSNTYNHNDFTILWSYRTFTKELIKSLRYIEIWDRK